MYGQNNFQPKRNWRMYIIAITLVVGAAFVFFLLNDKESITGAITGDDSVETTDTEGVIVVQNTAKTITTETEIAAEKDISLTFDTVPLINNRAKIDNLELNFVDPSTVITINGDRLELSNLGQIELNLEDYAGEILLNSNTISLSGTSKRIIVNDMALSSNKELVINFQNLNYESLDIMNIRLDHLDFPVGDGNLKAAENSLNYNLEDASLSLDYFIGNILVEKAAEGALTLNGNVKSMSVSSDLLNFNMN